MTDTRWLYLPKDRHQEVTCQVRCGNKTHTIVHTAKGELSLEKSHQRKRELNFMALGGKPCRCMTILMMWQGDPLGSTLAEADNYYGMNKVPEPLRREFLRRHEDRAAREHLKNSRPDLLELPFLERLEQRTIDAAKSVVNHCSYKRKWSTTVEVDMCLRAGDHKHSCQSERRYREQDRPDDYLGVWHFLVSASWYYKVYRRNLSLIAGCFVQRIVQLDPLFVVAVRQKENLELEQCGAWVIDKCQGPELQWTKDY